MQASSKDPALKNPARDFAVKVLQQKKSFIERVGPATDDPALARRQIQALTEVIEHLQRPVLKINPFW